jgi:hypothetical protein
MARRTSRNGGGLPPGNRHPLGNPEHRRPACSHSHISTNHRPLTFRSQTTGSVLLWQGGGGDHHLSPQQPVAGVRAGLLGSWS